jgi:hypothetical protein
MGQQREGERKKKEQIKLHQIKCDGQPNNTFVSSSTIKDIKSKNVILFVSFIRHSTFIILIYNLEHM